MVGFIRSEAYSLVELETADQAAQILVWIRPVLANNLELHLRMLMRDLRKRANQIGEVPPIEDGPDKKNQRLAGRSILGGA